MASSLFFIQPETKLTILSQPQSKLRFRYQSECHEKHGVIKSDDRRYPYPTVQVQLPGCQPPKTICVAARLYTEWSPDFHRFQNSHPDTGFIFVQVNDNNIAVFNNLRTECLKMKKIKELIYNKNLNDLNAVSIAHESKQFRDDFEAKVNEDTRTVCSADLRIQFQAFLLENNQYRPISETLFSERIQREKNTLRISRISACSGSCEGGEEIYILCNPVHRDDIEVHFIDAGTNAVVGTGEFNPNKDIHRQATIVVKTPPYNDMHTEMQASAKIQLYRPSDGNYSNEMDFTYYSVNVDRSRKAKTREFKAPTKRKLVRLECSTSSDTSGISEGSSSGYESAAQSSGKMLRVERSCSELSDNVSPNADLNDELNWNEFASQPLDEENNKAVDDFFQMFDSDYLEPFFMRTPYEMDDNHLESQSGFRLESRSSFRLESQSGLIADAVEKNTERLSKLSINNAKQLNSHSFNSALSKDTEISNLMQEKSNKSNQTLAERKYKFLLIKMLNQSLKKENRFGLVITLLKYLSHLLETEHENLLHSLINSKVSVLAFNAILKLLKGTSFQLINGVNQDCQTPLNLAVERNEVEMVNSLLLSGADPNVPDRYGNTAVHTAVVSESDSCLKQLLDKKADTSYASNITDLNIKNYDGCTALHLAAQKGLRSHIKLLCEAGADPNEKESKCGYSVLHLLVINHPDLISDILQNKNVFIDIKDSEGNTPLMLAYKYDLNYVAEQLTSAGANVNLCNEGTDEDTDENEDVDDDQAEEPTTSTDGGLEIRGTEVYNFNTDAHVAVCLNRQSEKKVNFPPPNCTVRPSSIFAIPSPQCVEKVWGHTLRENSGDRFHFLDRLEDVYLILDDEYWKTVALFMNFNENHIDDISKFKSPSRYLIETFLRYSSFKDLVRLLNFADLPAIANMICEICDTSP